MLNFFSNRETHVDRRQFITTGALASLALMAPLRWGRANTGNAEPKLWCFIDANGGWDPTLFCDPQAHPDFVSPSIFTSADLLTNSAGVTYAPKEVGQPYLVNGQDFFDKYANELLVINGVDTQTNNHKVGSRYMWSGRLGEGNPSLGALIAAIAADTQPNALATAFMSTGGYDRTNRLVTATRIAATEPLAYLTQPNLKKVGDPTTAYHHPEIEALIRSTLAERNDALLLNQGLPQVQEALLQLQSARDSEDALAALLPYLESIPEVDSDNPLLDPARMSLAAMKAGICVCANLSMAGFDTHANHDDIDDATGSGHRPRIHEVLEAIDYVLTLAEELDLKDRLTVVVGSDFGRTRYNLVEGQIGDAVTGPGKDHWPITSIMLLGQDIPAGVIGATHTDGNVSGAEAYEVIVNGTDIAPVAAEDVAAGTTTLIRPGISITRCAAWQASNNTP
jgi:uncharacterized protein (DUF1501 family)